VIGPGGVASGLILLLGLLLSACAAPAPGAARPEPAAPAQSPAAQAGAAPAPAAAAVAPASATAPAGAPAPISIHVVHNAVAGSQALLNVIQEGGLFTQHGLVVEISNASPRATTASLLTGEVPVMVSSGIHAITAGLAGGDTVIAAGGIGTLDTSLWTRDITDPAALRDRRIGVSTFGDAADFAARFAARRWGLDPNRDLQILQTGQPAERLAALQSGAVDATIIQPPLTVVARKAGLQQLAQISDLGLEYQHTSVVTTRARLESDPEIVERFVRAWAEGVYYYRANPEASRAAVGRFMNLEDPEALAETYERYIQWYSRPPYPNLRGIQTMLDQLTEEDERARNARPEDFVDVRFLDKLNAAGQFQRWEQQYPAAQ
jgi:ABC-type nitrate/sulfonate/bicarbonate transport system substrate-binding protein